MYPGWRRTPPTTPLATSLIDPLIERVRVASAQTRRTRRPVAHPELHQVGLAAVGRVPCEAHDVTHWQSGEQALCWTAAGLEQPPRCDAGARPPLDVSAPGGRDASRQRHRPEGERQPSGRVASGQVVTGVLGTPDTVRSPFRPFANRHMVGDRGSVLRVGPGHCVTTRGTLCPPRFTIRPLHPSRPCAF